jgi:hypothetical protein
LPGRERVVSQEVWKWVKERGRAREMEREREKKKNREQRTDGVEHPLDGARDAG